MRKSSLYGEGEAGSCKQDLLYHYDVKRNGHSELSEVRIPHPLICCQVSFWRDIANRRLDVVGDPFLGRKPSCAALGRALQMESSSTSLVLSTRVWTYGMHPSTQKNQGPAKTPRSRRNSCFGHSTFAHLPAGRFVGQDDAVFTPSHTERIKPSNSEEGGHANQRKQHTCTAKSSRAKAGILEPLVAWKEPRTGSRKAHKRLQGRHQAEPPTRFDCRFPASRIGRLSCRPPSWTCAHGKGLQQ